jgi:hypothetical protein
MRARAWKETGLPGAWWRSWAFLRFECPACGCVHEVRYEGPQPCWSFNGDFARPTVSPSILVQWEQGEARQKHICHSYVRDGQIQFLEDCTHELAGKTVDLPEVEG